MIRFARKEDYEQFDQLPSSRARAVVVEDDKGVAAIGGLAYFPRYVLAFMKVDRTLPVSMLKAAKFAIRSLFATSPLPIFAMRDHAIQTSGRFLEHFGFVPFEGDYYIWVGKQWPN